MEKKRFIHIDLLESIAIYFVIVYHSNLYSFDFIANNSFTNYFEYFFRTILSTCVPIFFFANGYLLLNRSFDSKKHFKKTVRLFLLQLIWGLILMPIYMVIKGEYLSAVTTVKYILAHNIEWGMNLFLVFNCPDKYIYIITCI